jgi:hypothetical protein
MQTSSEQLEARIEALLECLDAMIGPPPENGLATIADVLADLTGTLAPLAARRSVGLVLEHHDNRSITQRDRRRWHYLLTNIIERLLLEMAPGRKITVRLSGDVGSREYRWLQADPRSEQAASEVDTGLHHGDPEFRWLLAETALRIMDGSWSWSAKRDGSTLHVVAPIQR